MRMHLRYIPLVVLAALLAGMVVVVVASASETKERQYPVALQRASQEDQERQKLIESLRKNVRGLEDQSWVAEPS